MMKIWLSALLLVPLWGQFYITGEISPMVMIRQSDYGIIQLPTRSLTTEISYAFSQLDLKSSLSLEHRWNSSQPKADLRELYAIWYPDWGEVKVGKQILAWGAADGNNPTDNVNPYDYYFMFLPGTDRKLGTPLVSLTWITDWMQLEGVFVPRHQANRMPFNEPDFAFIPFDKPADELILTPESEAEYGIRLGTIIGETDITVSYFRGHDRNFTASALLTPAPGIAVPNFSYRLTQVYGADAVGFFGDITYRIEGAYFATRDEEWQISSSAQYYQLVTQVEFTGILDIQFTGQWIRSKTLEVSGEALVMSPNQPPGIFPLTKSGFQPGMGTPFAMLAENGLLAGAKATLLDNALEISLNTFYDLDEYGKMLGLTVDYSPRENWQASLGITTLMGTDDKPDYPFTALEDFSHYRVGLTYHF